MKLEEILNGPVPSFKGPLPGPCSLQQQKLVDVKQMCSVYAAGEFSTFQETVSTDCPPASPTRDLKVAGLLVKLSKGIENIRKNKNKIKKIKHPNAPMCSMLSAQLGHKTFPPEHLIQPGIQLF